MECFPALSDLSGCSMAMAACTFKGFAPPSIPIRSRPWTNTVVIMDVLKSDITRGVFGRRFDSCLRGYPWMWVSTAGMYQTKGKETDMEYAKGLIKAFFVIVIGITVSRIIGFILYEFIKQGGF